MTLLKVGPVIICPPGFLKVILLKIKRRHFVDHFRILVNYFPESGFVVEIKLGLYSITYGGIWYNGSALSFEEFCKKAKDLGAKIVRLFAAWPGVVIHEGVGTYDLTRGNFYTFERQFPFATRLDRWNFARECLKEAADFGEE